MALPIVKEVSAWLQVKQAAVYGWVAEGMMPALKIQRLRCFQREKIESWLDGCQIEPPNPSRPVRRLRSIAQPFHTPAPGRAPVSYTHLTLPTSDLV